MSFKQQPKGFSTKAVHAGQDMDNWGYKSIVPPIVTSTIFKLSSPGDYSGYSYSRVENPTREVLETCLASLDNGKYGLTFPSGLGNLSAVMSTINTGDHVIMGDDVYGGISRFMREISARQGIETTFVDPTDLVAMKAAMKPNTKVIWIETPSNPLMKVCDIEAVSKIARMRPGVLFVIDNTFLTSYFQRPLEMGADLVAYSVSKYMNGHSDVIMGAVVTNDENVYKRLKFVQYASGSVPSPRDCHLVNRSLKTLPLRMEQHQKSGFQVAKFLESHPLVEKVLHPGLPSHPQHKLAMKQSYGHSGMISFYIKGGMAQSKKFMKALRVFVLAESFGGSESLVEVPSVMTHAIIPEEMRKKLNITDNLIRLSVGLEDTDDLIEDLGMALKAAQQ